MENVMNNGQGAGAPQSPPQAPQYAQNVPQPPQNVQYPQYGPGGSLPPKKKMSTLSKVLLIGCSVLGVLALIALALVLIMGISIYNQEDPFDTAVMLENFELKDKPLVTYNSSDEIIGKIHLNMPKDSVLMELGRPAEYNYAKWGDNIIYNFNDSSMTIVFDHGDLVEYYTTPGGKGASIFGDDEAVVVEDSVN